MSAVASSSAFNVKYCSLCDAYFYSAEMLKAHLQSSRKHPQCSTCDKRFLNNNSLRNHYVLSSKHNFCRICEKHFQTPAGLRIHIEFSHLDSDTEDEPSSRPDGWEDELGMEQDAALYGGEIPIPQEDTEAVSGLTARVAVINLRKAANPTGVCSGQRARYASRRGRRCARRDAGIYSALPALHMP
ncbi:hypothetical protein MSAN_01268100 [Mycena sanguinolenta]|uniref:C2H2-type domain-containing protein n=1 Tax=Mycena sanguinolenta TaxID=230812 RepID=A0A8H6YGF9_9AGAR|nr:hypothetical protein MSAN_01268100 [Mycena sanguinolenta]